MERAIELHVDIEVAVVRMEMEERSGAPREGTTPALSQLGKLSELSQQCLHLIKVSIRRVSHVHSMTRQRFLAALEHHGDSLTAADAQSRDAELHVALCHLEEQGDEDACAAGTDWVPDGNGTAVDVEAVLGNGKLTADGDGLRRERFVELEEVDVTQLDTCFLQRQAYRGDGSHAHDAGGDTRARVTADARQRNAVLALSRARRS